MTIRITGMNSGLDTDTIIKELVKASSEKKTDLEKAKTKVEWTQAAWKTMNSKVSSFFNGTLANLQYESSYNKKKTTVADSNIASIVAGDNAVNGTQTLAVKQLATSGYLTGAKLSENKAYKGTAKLSEFGIGGGGSTADISVKVGTKETKISLTGDMTLSDLTAQLNKAGITANFDEINQRLFLSAKGTGEASDFTLTGTNSGGTSALAALGLVSASDMDEETRSYIGLTEGTSAYTDKYNEILTGLQDYYAAQNAEYEAQIAEVNTARASYLGENSNEDDTTSPTNQELYDSIAGGTTEEKLITLNGEADVMEEAYAALDTAAADYDTKKAALDAQKAELQQKFKIANTVKGLEDVVAEHQDNIEANKVLLNQSVSTDPSNPDTTLADMAKSQLTAKINNANYISSLPSESGAVRIKGQDAVINLNGADFTSATNSFSVNGLTITANAVSASSEKYYNAAGDEVEKGAADAVTSKTEYATTTVNTETDVDGIYKMIKDFISGYNALVNEFDSLYNADSSKGYEPLTSEEKDAMSDTEVEQWEKKIKDSLLRRDSNLGSLTSIFKTAMLEGFTIDGKRTTLATYGIETMSYFLAADNEKGAYHIDGNPDDTSSSEQPDKLKSAIASDPKSVASFFSKLTNNMYMKLNKFMRGSDYRSVYNVYDDKKLQKEYDNYTSKIKEQQDKLTALEDRYYKQFASMETAMSKLNSTQSYISSLFG